MLMTLCMLRDISRAMSVYDLQRRATSISRWFTAMRQRPLSDRVSAGLNFRFRSTRSSRAFVIIATNNASSVDAVSGQQGGLVTTEHELKEARTHKSVNTHAGTWPLTFCPKINDFFQDSSGNVLYDAFDDPGCISFWDVVRKNRQTHRQTAVKTVPALSERFTG